MHRLQEQLGKLNAKKAELRTKIRSLIQKKRREAKYKNPDKRRIKELEDQITKSVKAKREISVQAMKVVTEIGRARQAQKKKRTPHRRRR